jgi:hypothetical protein
MNTKYLRDTGIFYSKRNPSDSPLWTYMLKVKSVYLSGMRMRMHVGDGKLTSFWYDAWCSTHPLKEIFPDIFNICNEQGMTVTEAAVLGWNFSFRRYLAPDLAMQVHGLLNIVRQIVLSQEKDRPSWKWSKN